MTSGACRGCLFKMSTIHLVSLVPLPHHMYMYGSLFLPVFHLQFGIDHCSEWTAAGVSYFGCVQVRHLSRTEVADMAQMSTPLGGVKSSVTTWRRCIPSWICNLLTAARMFLFCRTLCCAPANRLNRNQLVFFSSHADQTEWQLVPAMMYTVSKKTQFFVMINKLRSSQLYKSCSVTLVLLFCVSLRPPKHALCWRQKNLRQSWCTCKNAPNCMRYGRWSKYLNRFIHMCFVHFASIPLANISLHNLSVIVIVIFTVPWKAFVLSSNNSSDQCFTFSELSTLIFHLGAIAFECKLFMKKSQWFLHHLCKMLWLPNSLVAEHWEVS